MKGETAATLKNWRCIRDLAKVFAVKGWGMLPRPGPKQGAPKIPNLRFAAAVAGISPSSAVRSDQLAATVHAEPGLERAALVHRHEVKSPRR